MTLKDKRIAALGGTSGIGLAVAQAALEEGASVVVASRKQADVDSAQAKLALQSPSRIAAQVVDVTSEENLVSITLYNGMLYGALWEFQPLGTGTAILVATTATALILRLPAARFLECIIQTWRQTRATLLTVMSMVGLAYLMNYSGLNYTIGKGVASLGSLFVVLAPSSAGLRSRYRAPMRPVTHSWVTYKSSPQGNSALTPCSLLRRTRREASSGR